MKNADMPIHPLTTSSGSPANITDSDGYYSQESQSFAFGLSKREHFAAIAMQGILSSRFIGDFCEGDSVCPAAVAKAAANYADSLLRELDK